MIKVSLITPVFNVSEEKSKITIDSVLRQTCKDFEWVIVLDEMVKEVSYPKSSILKTKIITLGNNYGPSVARNIGFMASDADLIAYVDVGDELNLDRIGNLITLHEKHNASLYLSKYYLADKYGEGATVQCNNLADLTVPTIRQILDHQNISIPLGIAHDRQAWYRTGGFQRGIVCGEDGIFLRRLVKCLPDDKIILDPSMAGVYIIDLKGQSRTQRRFDMGGFAFDADNEHGSHGQYLDEDWFTSCSSVRLFNERNI